MSSFIEKEKEEEGENIPSAVIDLPNSVSSGAFGCVFGESLGCDGGHPMDGDKEYISKLVTKEDAKVEMESYRRVRQVDPDAVFTSESPIVCGLQRKYNRKSIKKKCPTTTKLQMSNEEMDDYRVLHIKNLGSDLLDVLSTEGNISYVLDFIRVYCDELPR